MHRIGYSNSVVAKTRHLCQSIWQVHWYMSANCLRYLLKNYSNFFFLKYLICTMIRKWLQRQNANKYLPENLTVCLYQEARLQLKFCYIQNRKPKQTPKHSNTFKSTATWQGSHGMGQNTSVITNSACNHCRKFKMIEIISSKEQSLCDVTLMGQVPCTVS